MRLSQLAVAGLIVGASAPASAAVYSDELGKCLVQSTSQQDKVDLITWIFADFALNPLVGQYANISDQQRATINHAAGALLTRLLGTDCHDQTVQALKYEGAASLQTAFSLLGQVAARGLMSDPAVAKGTASLAASADPALISGLAKEAGLLP